jgi:small subunit ribosomal protein S2
MITLEKLVKSGVHLGHDTSVWNPKMKPYIYKSQNGRYVLNLLQTTKRLKQACTFLIRAGYENKSILFVGTTEASSKLIKTKAIKAKAHYVNHRWIGGMLTNYTTMVKSIKKLRISSKTLQKVSKKEASILVKKQKNLMHIFGGIQDMKTRPDIVIFIGQPGRSNPLKECRSLGITTIALVDTNSNPEFVDLPIPANDQSITSIELILNALSSAICAGQKIRLKFKTRLDSSSEEKNFGRFLSPGNGLEPKDDLKQLKLSSYLTRKLEKSNIKTLSKLSQCDEKTLSPMESNLLKRALVNCTQ